MKDCMEFVTEHGLMSEEETERMKNMGLLKIVGMGGGDVTGGVITMFYPVNISQR